MNTLYRTIIWALAFTLGNNSMYAAQLSPEGMTLRSRISSDLSCPEQADPECALKLAICNNEQLIALLDSVHGPFITWFSQQLHHQGIVAFTQQEFIETPSSDQTKSKYFPSPENPSHNKLIAQDINGLIRTLLCNNDIKVLLKNAHHCQNIDIENGSDCLSMLLRTIFSQQHTFPNNAIGYIVPKSVVLSIQENLNTALNSQLRSARYNAPTASRSIARTCLRGILKVLACAEGAMLVYTNYNYMSGDLAVTDPGHLQTINVVCGVPLVLALAGAQLLKK